MAGHTERQWEGKFFRCGMRCYWCLKPLCLIPQGEIEIATKDHLTPTCRGGSDSIDNIVPACFECNRRKGPMTEQEYRKAFHTAWKILKGVPSAGDKLSLSERDEPLLAEIRKENESVSWAWRTPADSQYSQFKR